MRIALVQFDPTVGDLSGNAERILNFARQAAASGADLVLFPELALCGYPPMDLAHEPWFIEANERELAALAEELPVPCVLGHLSRNRGVPGPIAHNSGSLLAGGEVKGTRHKRLLPTYDVFDEYRLFAAGAENTPIRLGNTVLGISICEDIWGGVEAGEKGRYDIDPCRDLVRAGAKILLNLSASPYSIGHRARRHQVVAAAAKKLGVPVAQTNIVGATDGLIFDGSSIVVDADGDVVACAPRFVENMTVVDIADVPSNPPDPQPDDDHEVIEALLLGTRAYLAKTGFSDVVLGLSGGIDSALVAALAAEALGPEHVLGITMPARHSSSGSVSDSRDLAENLGIRFEELSIEPLFSKELELVEPLLGDLGHGIAAQNLQARSRGIVLMAVSNHTGALVLPTGNKSELAVGYATLYGDMCGALSLIGDLYKTRVYALSGAFNERRGEAIPQAILDKEPSAELAPDQKDTDSLPPYPELDGILYGLIEHMKSPDEVAAAGISSGETAHRIAKMLARAEYKRHQFAPILRASTRVLGRGRRMVLAAKPYG